MPDHPIKSGTAAGAGSRFPGYDVLSKRDTPSWNEQTRRVIDARMAVADEPKFFTADEFATVRAIADRMVPQPPEHLAGRAPVRVAALVDQKLHLNKCDGYRHAGMPREREAWRLGLRALDVEAQERHGKAFRELIDVLEQAPLRRLMEEKFSIDLTGRPTLITVRGASRLKDGKIHTDSETKLLTVLIYLNKEWTQPGGRLRMLRSRDNIEDYVAEVPPTHGTLLAFERSPNAWHGHLPCEGIRRSVQLNWVRDASVVAGQARRHGLSAFFKTLMPLKHIPD